MKVKVRKAMFYIDDMTCDATLGCAFKTAEEAIDFIYNEQIHEDLSLCMHYSAYKVWTRVRLGYGGWKPVAEIVVNHAGKYTAENLVKRIEYFRECEAENIRGPWGSNPMIVNEIERLEAELDSIQAV